MPVYLVRVHLLNGHLHNKERFQVKVDDEIGFIKTEKTIDESSSGNIETGHPFESGARGIGATLYRSNR